MDNRQPDGDITASHEHKRMWGGRFSGETDDLVKRFNASIDVDSRMALEDIEGSIAHATMLAERGILAQDEVTSIVEGLRGILRDVLTEKIVWSIDDEDVHMNVERLLTDRIGPVAGKLHTARSRNDQVATDFRLWLRRATEDLIALLADVRRTFVDFAEQHLGTIMPGYTHLQVAQPVLLSHHMMAYYEMFTRDGERFEDSLKRLCVSPLGAGALAGTGFPINRRRTAKMLGFERAARNSLDAVSDRDFALEFLSHASIAMVHLSRLCEELILWSSEEFSFITLPDSHTTGSSIMPQKKNPDVCELVRGKTGRVCGSLMSLLMIMKGLPLAYNKDMQEDKEGVFDAVHTLRISLELISTMLPTTDVHAERMRDAASRGFSNATDLADYLAKRGLPFRQAHEVVGKLVMLADSEGVKLEDLELSRMQEVSDLIGYDIYDMLAAERVVSARTSYGGTAQSQVKHQIRSARKALGRA